MWFIGRLREIIRAQDAALAQNREQALRQDWLASVGSLAASTAHELGSPLGTLNLLTEELLDHPECPPAVREDLALMQETVLRCRHILSRLQQRVAGPEQQATELSHWLRDVLLGWQAQNPTASLALPKPFLRSILLTPCIEQEREIARRLDVFLTQGLKRIRAEVRDTDTGVLLRLVPERGPYCELSIKENKEGSHV